MGETIISKIFSIKLTINPVKSLGSEFFTTPAEVKIILPSQIQLVEGELIQTINFTDLSPKSTEIKVKALAVGSFVIKAVVQKQNSGEFKKDLTINIISPDETSNWKTYRDEKYGFEVKYPLHWAPKPGYVNGPVSGYIQVSASNAKNIDDAILIPVGPGAPEVLGKNPVTKEMEIEGQTARLITNTAPKYVLFAVQYPQPVKINNDYYQYLNLLFIDSSEYAEQILSTFRFTP